MNSKTKTKTIKNLISYITVFAFFILANLGLFQFKSTSTGFAATESTGITSVTIPNSNFNSNTSSTQPFSPNEFTPSIDEEEANLKAGVINLDKGDYSKYSKNPLSNDEYVLMIDSVDDDGKYHYVDFGYITEDTISMSENSNYRITVDVFTSNSDGIATIYLFNDDGSVFGKIDNITSQSWSTYCMLISTNETESLNLKLGLYIQGSGTVLFDNISCDKLSDKALANNLDAYQNLNKVHHKYLNKRENTIANYPIDSSVKFTKTKYDINNQYTTKKVVSSYEDANASDGTRNTAVKIENTNETYATYSTNDDFLTLSQNSIYKITVTAKATNLSGKANLQLVQTNLDKDETANNSSSLSVSNVTSNSGVYNGYKQYTFYARTGSIGDVTYKLELSLGSEDNLTTGCLYVSNVELSKVDYATYNNATSGSTTDKTIDLCSQYFVKDNEIMLDNGNFNSFEIPSSTQSFPAKVTDWDVTEGSNKQYHGVINTKDFAQLSSLNLGITNPGDPGLSLEKDNNNVLMMYNSAEDHLSYTSASKPLEAKSYYKFSLDVQASNTPLNVSLVSTKDDKEFVLFSKNISTNTLEWKTVEFYVYSGYQDIDVKIKLELNSTEKAYAFIDNAMFNYTTQPTETIFNNVVENDYTFKADLSNIIYFDENNLIDIKGISKNNTFTSSSTENVLTGVISLNNSVNSLIETEYVSTFTNLTTENKNIVMIRSYNDVAFALNSNIGFKLASDKFYQVSVSVYTQNLQAMSDNEADFGACLKLSGFDGEFGKINSDNAWSTYSFLLNPSSDITTYLTLALGDETYKTTGDVFFGNITLTELENFDNIEENNTVKKFALTTATNNDSSDSDNTDEGSGFNNANLLYQISSLIFVAAIIITVVGVALRKVKWKKRSVKADTNYDRKDTVSKQYYSRLATTKIEETLRELDKELVALNNERSKFEENYKKDISKLREMKIKRANPQDIAKLDKDMKKNQKIAAQIGVKISKIQNQIEFVKTDGYKNDLIRKLQLETKNSLKKDN